MKYNNIELDLPSGPVSLSHSMAMDMIQGKSGTENMDWTEKLGEFPWGDLKDKYLHSYVKASELYSLIHMDYQVCNGGIDQYFFNRYHEERPPHSKHDVELYNIDEQKRVFTDLVKFAKEIYPERETENQALSRAAAAFDKLSFEENAAVTETVYCDEDKYILDENGEEIENPDYFEPYDEMVYEDVIHGDDGFDDIFYGANDYLEELMELRAQYLCKEFAREIEQDKEIDPGVLESVRKTLPESAFSKVPDTKKPSLSEQIQSAANKTSAGSLSTDSKEKDPERF